MCFIIVRQRRALKMLGVDLQSFMSDGCLQHFFTTRKRGNELDRLFFGGIGRRVVRSNARCLLQMCLPFAHDTLFPIVLYVEVPKVFHR